MSRVERIAVRKKRRSKVDDDLDDDEQWMCAYPDKCLMPSPDHHRSECYTVEDAEAYYAEAEGLQVKEKE